MPILRRSRLLLSCSIVVILGVAPAASAGPVTLAWNANPEPDIAGYALSYGLTPGAYSTTVNVGKNTTWTVNVPDGAIYYFAVRAYNTAGQYSAFSNEVFTIVGSASPPFGLVDTPIDGANGVQGSIGVTGWALDDSGVSRVWITRDPVAGEGSAQVYIGDAVLVEGARPDVAAAYPAYPYSTRAAWGYLLLTNMLPYQGNGSYRLNMYAADAQGRTTWLGSRRFTADNAHATKPFGSIDTPGQGATVSGSAYANFGWTLTPQPYRVPFNGSTISVVVDGVVVGHPGALGARADIQALFPGYANTNNAVGAFMLNTTGLSNGVHTIAWVVSDTGGRAEGIGSRYFTVQNGAVTTGLVAQPLSASPAFDTAGIPTSTEAAAPLSLTDSGQPVWTRLGAATAPLQKTPLEGGTRPVVAKELERIEIHLTESDSAPGSTFDGHLAVGSALQPLPFGSTLDRNRGIFYWQPGVGFIGAYNLVFTRTGTDGAAERFPVTVYLTPKNSGASDIQMSIDLPKPGDVLQPFLVAGWAIDRAAAAGTGVDTLHVWAYPVTPAGYGTPLFLGVARYGDVRGDVGVYFGQQFSPSAFGLVAAGLGSGTYDIAVFPYSAVTGRFENARVVRVTVR